MSVDMKNTIEKIDIKILKEIRYYLYNLIPDLPECHVSVMENSKALTHIQNLIYSLTQKTDDLTGGKKENTLTSALKLQELVKEALNDSDDDVSHYWKIKLEDLVEESEKT